MFCGAAHKLATQSFRSRASKGWWFSQRSKEKPEHFVINAVVHEMGAATIYAGHHAD